MRRAGRARPGRWVARWLAAGALLASGAAWSAARPLVVCDDISDPLTLDPQKEFSEKNHTICQQIFDGLVRFDSGGRIEPALATEWRRLDPLTVQFKLREGVVFHNGEAFDSGSVKETIERYLDPKTGFPAAGFLNSIDHVDVVDERTVNIVTKFPDGLLLNRLAGFVLITPPKYIRQVGEKGFAEKPVGTGAFRFAGWQRGREIELEANPDYWMKGYPKADRLVFRFIPADRQLNELLEGRVDILTELPGTATLAVARSRSARVIKKQTFYTLAGTFNVNKGPLQDARVRQALNYATDREELIRYDLMGNGRPLATFSMPGEEGYDPELKPYPYDLSKARQLLEQAGFAKGLRLKAFVKSTGERAARILKAQWKKAGVELDYAVKNEGDLINEIRKASLDMAFGGCPDPMAHVFFIQSISLFSQSPFSFIKDPEYDRRLIEMVSTLDEDERTLRARQLDRYVHDQALSVFTYQKIKTYGVRRDVRFEPYVTGMPYFFGASTSEETARRRP